MSAVDPVKGQEERIEKAARAGYVPRGTVFVVIGYFAAKAAYSTGRTMSSPHRSRGDHGEMRSVDGRARVV